MPLRHVYTGILITLLIVGIIMPVQAQSGDKIAVLYFKDQSGFDSGGCLSIWPFRSIFGTGKQREKWDLQSGFRDMLNEKLVENGYEIVETKYADQSIEDLGKDNLSALASKLNADMMIIGDIRNFGQHRMRASSQGPTVYNPSETTRMVAMGGIGGFYYSSRVETNMTFYDDSGDVLKEIQVESKKNLADFYMGVGPMTYHRGDTEQDEKTEVEPPIVDYDKLDKMKFGTEEFKNKTLFGLATMDVMDKVVSEVQEYMKPTEIIDVEGKIIYVGTGKRLKNNQVYIDLGAIDGLKPGLKLGVYLEPVILVDPDTGEEIGNIEEKKIAEIKVIKVEADHLSIAEVINKTEEIEKGNFVKAK
ncbi:hypothetical protein GF312_09915 [Candidatus Poribacteria bacterium]|nr:hypothetical protein [Candidatus Poribacteria bacterium]